MYYSIRSQNTKKKNRKKSFLYISLSIIIVLLFFFLGIKILVNIINIITDFKKSDTNPDVTDSIPPRIPSLDAFPEYTSIPEVDIKGSAEVGSLVTITLNGRDSEVVVGNTGNFVHKIILSEGENEFNLYSEDSSRNRSSNTKTYIIVFDKTPPSFEIISPSDGASFYGSKQRLVEIKGKSESDSTITINERYTGVSSDGSFYYKYELNPGENAVSIIAHDMAGNEESKTFTLYYYE